MLLNWTRRAARRTRTADTSRPRVEALEDRRLLSAGALDTTFGSGGKVITPVPTSLLDAAQAVAYQPDGKMVVAGSSGGQFHGAAAVARYNANGTLDTTFGSGGRAVTPLGGQQHSFLAADVEVLPGGKILVLGNDSTGFSTSVALIRYNANGTLDTTFGSGGSTVVSLSAAGTDLTVLPGSGTILVGGNDGTPSSGGPFALMRFDAGGTFDATLGVVLTPVGSFGHVNKVIGQPDGKIVLVGQARPFLGTTDFTVVRYNTDGTQDTTFGSGGTAQTDFGATSDFALTAALHSDGKLRVFGVANGAPGVRSLAIAQYTAAGALDTTIFNHTGKSLTSNFDPGFGVAKAVVAGGKLVLAGTKANDLAVQEYTVDGAPVTSFGGGAVVTADLGGVEAGAAVAVRPDGKVAVVGRSDSNATDFAVAQFTPAGALDAAFAGTGKTTLDFLGSNVETDNPSGGFVAQQLDGKTLVAGTVLRLSLTGGITQANGDFVVTRYNANGTLDASFGSGGVATVDFGGDDHLRGVTVDFFGRVTVVGSTGLSFSRDVAVARLRSNGTLDTSFNGTGKEVIDLGADDVAAGVGVDLFGRTLIAATTGDPFGGTHDFAVTRLTSAGALDTGYGTAGTTLIDFGTADAPADDVAAGLAVDLFGNATVAGTTGDPFGGNRDVVVARLNGSGALDTHFGVGGKTTIDFGTVDAPTDDVAASVAIDLFGRTVIAATTGFQGSRDVAVARLTWNGSLDTTFGTGGKTTVDFGADDTAAGVAIDLFGRIIVGATTAPDFDHKDMAVARLNGNGSLDTSYGTGGKTVIDFGGADVLAGVSVDIFGRVVVGGTTFGNDGPEFAVARLKGDLF